jgi:acyl-CoA synthetase (AMP-forming)/AMP-acid ligase II
MIDLTRTNPLPPGDDLVSVLRFRELHQPDTRAFVFLDPNATADEQTYAQLDRRARAIAAILQRADLTGERALLVFEPGLDFIAAFIGCLYAGVTAVPVYPPDPLRVARTLPRLKKIIANCQAAALLSTSSLSHLADSLCADQDISLVLTTDDMDIGVAGAWSSVSFPDDHLAILQYTSGSTGDPKGVMVTHGNLRHNMRQVHTMVDRQDAVTVCWLPVYHDMGLIGGVLQPWYSGKLCVLMSPLSFYQQPIRWLEAISDYRATTAVAPDFAFDLCVRKTKPDERGRLDLRSWCIAMNGSEPIRPTTLERFVKAFQPAGARMDMFYPCYGLAEATLVVAGGLPGQPPLIRGFRAADLGQGKAAQDPSDDQRTRRLVGCGFAAPDETLLIVDPDSGCPRPDGTVGEIWISGPNVARGYWGDAKSTQETFQAYLVDGTGPFLRTGDLGFINDGQLFVTGRMKDIIIVHGRNHYPQDIERTVETCHAALKPHAGAVFSVDDGERESVVIVHEVLRPGRSDLDQVLTAIAAEVSSEHHIPVDEIVLIKPSTIPKTTSGKIRRRACRERYRDNRLATVIHWKANRRRATPESLSLNYVAPRTETECAIVEIWEEVLGVERIGINDNFFDLGGHSLLATQIAQRIDFWVPSEVSLRDLFDRPTVAQLAAWLDELSALHEPEVGRLLDAIEELDEDEARRLAGERRRTAPAPSEFNEAPLTQPLIWDDTVGP